MGSQRYHLPSGRHGSLVLRLVRYGPLRYEALIETRSAPHPTDSRRPVRGLIIGFVWRTDS